eukprot:PhM_4_TR1321/c3_g1_i5/m.101092
MLLPETHVNMHMFDKLASKETIIIDGFSISLKTVPFCFYFFAVCEPGADQAGPNAVCQQVETNKNKNKPHVVASSQLRGGGHKDSGAVPTDDDEKYSRDFAMKPGNMIPAWPIYEVMTACHDIISTFTHGGQARDAL